MSAIELPTVKHAGHTIVINFHTQILLFETFAGDFEMLPFYKFECQLILAEILRSEEGKREFKRYRDECFKAGYCISQLKFYEDYVFRGDDWKPHVVKLPTHKNIIVNFEKGILTREGREFRLDSLAGNAILKDLFGKPKFLKDIRRYERECTERGWNLDDLNHYKNKFLNKT